MKSLILLIFSCFCFFSAQAADIKIIWTPNPESEKVSNYNILYGTESGKLTQSKQANKAEVIISELADNTQYFFAVNAQNASGTSALSDEVAHKTPPATPKYQFLDKVTWKISVTSEESSLGKNEKEKALDSDSSTFWHSKWLDGTLPQSFSVNLGKMAKIEGISYLPRQDEFLVGVIRNYELSTSQDGMIWSVASSGEFENTKAEKILSFAERNAKFVKLTAKTDWKNGKEGRVAIAEFKVVGIYIPELAIPSKPVGLKVTQ